MNKDIPIGETFHWEGIPLIVVASDIRNGHYCKTCYFSGKSSSCRKIKNLPECFQEERADGKHVIFKRRENDN